MTVQVFNLAPPPNFCGLDPNKPVSVYYRHLPHWRQEGATYFVTFRLADSLPCEKLECLKRLREEWERVHPPPQRKDAWESYAGNIFRHVETWLDEGYGQCHFRNPQLAAPLEESLLHFQNERYSLSCSVIMPNHCHLVIQPFVGWSLERILKGIKGVVARRVNAVIGVSGSLWQDESYDRVVRDEEHLWRIIQYMGRNPERAGLPLNAWRRWVRPDWEAAGWRFVDD